MLMLLDWEIQHIENEKHPGEMTHHFDQPALHESPEQQKSPLWSRFSL